MAFNEPSKYSNSFSELYLMFNTAIAKLPNDFIKYKLGQNNNYTNTTNNINNIRSDIFTEQQELFSSTESIKQEIEKYNFYIKVIEKENAELTNTLKKFKNTGLAAEGELKMQKTIYRELITRNLILLLIILRVISQVIINKIYKKN
jgi:hypothetical protein